MKAKLAAVREALVESIQLIGSEYCSHGGNCGEHERCFAKTQYKALALLDEVLAELESEALVERMSQVIKSIPLSISSTRRSSENGLRNADEVAQAAINAIKGE